MGPPPKLPISGMRPEQREAQDEREDGIARAVEDLTAQIAALRDAVLTLEQEREADPRSGGGPVCPS